MSDLSDKLKQKFLDRVSGELESCEVPGLDDRIYWKPLTGQQQRQSQKAAEKSTAEGICLHVKLRALDEKKELVFGDVALVGMMHDFDFKVISAIFFKMTGDEIGLDDIEKN